ncbi:Maf family protein [Lacunimicrobium album]
MSPLILASSSRYRRMLLERLRIPFDSISPDVDEEAVKQQVADPMQLATTLARAKAIRIFEAHPDTTVIGSDQLAACDDQILGKPHAEENAINQLLSLAGRTHHLITAVFIASPDGHKEFVDITRLTMRPLTRDEARRYVHADQPLDCAGSYKFESLGVTLFDAVKTEDMTAITGLPLMKLAQSLRELGYQIP